MNKMKVKCHKCGYEWDTKSKRITVTCPSCQYKTPVRLMGEKEEKQ